VGKGKKLNTEGTEVAHKGHGEEQVDNRDWQRGWVRGNGKAIAMVGWGHLLFALYAAAKWSCAAGRTQVDDAAHAAGGRIRSSGTPEAQNRGKNTTGGGDLSSIIINWLGIRSNGGKSQNPQP